jgi:ATP-dependent Lon protease
MYLIRTKGFKMADKLKISNNYLLPDIMERCGFKNTNVRFEEEAIRFIINNYTYEGGVRKLKENLLEITREVNLRKLNNSKILGKKVRFPLKISKKMIVDDIFKKKNVYNFTKIHKEPRVGCVNGLYASDNGEGGVTQIETTRVPSESALSLTLTGSQGKVMKESMSVAKSVAWTLLPSRLKSKLNNEWKKTGNKGVHIHCPEGATPKDGPSAGAAITTALVSLFTGIPVNNKIAMTGEINLNGRVMEIGGLDDKVIGAKKAGAELVLCPKDNKKDLEKIRESNYNPEDKTFKIVMVDNIWEVLKYALVDSDKCLFNKF